MAVVTFLVLALQSRGFRPMEAVISALFGVIALCYVIETLLDKPDWGQVAYHAVTPSFAGAESVLLATGILGATIMPRRKQLQARHHQRRWVRDHGGCQSRCL